ncbi:MAG TPA: c-type cytochrome [Roseiflexaceae bacterium]|nr:c-type cytochrome [Roseiflexaceae bacterium]
MFKFSLALAVVGMALLLLSALPGRAAPATPAVPTADQVAYGRALFSAKGCVTCHHHAAVAGSGTFGEGNPDLTTFRWSADYLRTWLKDPAAVRPNTYMPNLGLKSDEIEALIAFLSAGANH